MKYSKIFLIVAINLIAVGVLAMGSSFLGDYLQSSGFFGDEYRASNYGMRWDWAYRHYVYVVILGALFILRIVMVVTQIDTILKQQNN